MGPLQKEILDPYAVKQWDYFGPSRMSCSHALSLVKNLNMYWLSVLCAFVLLCFSHQYKKPARHLPAFLPHDSTCVICFQFSKYVHFMSHLLLKLCPLYNTDHCDGATHKLRPLHGGRGVKEKSDALIALTCFPIEIRIESRGSQLP